MLKYRMEYSKFFTLYSRINQDYFKNLSSFIKFSGFERINQFFL